MREAILTYAIIGLGTLFWALTVNCAVATAGHLIDLMWHLGILSSMGEDPEPPDSGIVFIAVCLAIVFVGTLVLSLLGVI